MKNAVQNRRLFKLKILFLLVGMIICNFVFGQTKSVLDSLDKEFKKTNSLHLKMDLLLEKSNQCDFEDIELYANQLLDLCDSISGIWQFKSQHEDSVLFFKSQAYNNLGYYFDNVGNVSLALKNYYKALSITEQIRDTLGIGIALINLSAVYIERNDTAKALDQLEKANQMFHSIGHLENEGFVLNNIGTIYSRMNEDQKSLDYFMKNIQIQEKLKHASLSDYGYGNVGFAYLRLHQLDSAFYFINKALDVAKLMGSENDLCVELFRMGMYYAEVNEDAKALKYYEESLEIALRMDFLNLQKHLYLYLSDLMQKSGKHEEALIYYKNHVSLDSSIMSSENKKSTIRRELEHENYQKALKDSLVLIQSRAELRTQRDVNERNTYIIIASVFLLIFVTLLALLGYSLQNLKQKRLIKENGLKDELAKALTEKKLAEERVRISRELHDNIGANLSYAISSLGMIDQDNSNADIQKVKADLKTTISDFRDTIWSMNEGQVDLVSLRLRIQNICENYKHLQVSLKVDIAENRFISSQVALNIIRILQEALNNAVKYSNSEQIEIRLLANGDFRLEIEDFGVGFDLNVEGSMSFGLKNMNARASEINGQLFIESAIGKGTKVRLII